jgi:hypothetical protein
MKNSIKSKVLLIIALGLLIEVPLFAKDCEIEGLMGDIAIINGGVRKVNDSVCGGTLVAIDDESVIIKIGEKDVVYKIGKIKNPKPRKPTKATNSKSKKNKENDFLAKFKNFFKKDDISESSIKGKGLQAYYERAWFYFNQAEAAYPKDLKKALALYKRCEKEAKVATTFLPKKCKDLTAFHRQVLDLHIKCLNQASQCEVDIFKKKHPDARVIN